MPHAGIYSWLSLLKEGPHLEFHRARRELPARWASGLTSYLNKILPLKADQKPTDVGGLFPLSPVGLQSCPCRTSSDQTTHVGQAFWTLLPSLSEDASQLTKKQEDILELRQLMISQTSHGVIDWIKSGQILGELGSAREYGWCGLVGLACVWEPGSLASPSSATDLEHDPGKSLPFPLPVVFRLDCEFFRSGDVS